MYRSYCKYRDEAEIAAWMEVSQPTASVHQHLDDVDRNEVSWRHGPANGRTNGTGE